MTFTTTNLVDNRVLVKDGKKSVVLDGTEWAAIKAELNAGEAHAGFDAAVNEFFAPLLAAQAELESSHQIEVDPLTFVVLQEGTPSVAGTDTVVVQLSKDSQILRIIEAGDTSRLVWVGDDLEITAS